MLHKRHVVIFEAIALSKFGMVYQYEVENNLTKSDPTPSRNAWTKRKTMRVNDLISQNKMSQSHETCRGRVTFSYLHEERRNSVI